MQTIFLRYKELGWKLKAFLSTQLLQFSLSCSSLSILSQFFWTPLLCCTSPSFIGTFPFLLSLVDLLLAGFKGYLSNHPFVMPSFHHEIRLLEVSLVFRLVYKHLMWKRLGRKHLINAEVTASVILILSWHFLRRV